MPLLGSQRPAPCPLALQPVVSPCLSRQLFDAGTGTFTTTADCQQRKGLLIDSFSSSTTAISVLDPRTGPRAAGPASTPMPTTTTVTGSWLDARRTASAIGLAASAGERNT